MNKKFFLVFLLSIAFSFPLLSFAEFGLGPPFTQITITFVSSGVPQEGVMAIMVDESNQEQKAVSNQKGQIKFTIQASTGNVFITYWKDENAVLKKALEYHAGNHYHFELELAE